MTGIAPLAPSTDTVGPVAASVADAMLLYRVLGGVLPVLPGADRTARIGVLRAAMGHDPRIVAAMDKTCTRLVRAGSTLVEDFTLDGLEDWLAGPHIVDAEFAAAFDTYLAQHFAAGTAPTTLAALVASGHFLADHAEALHRRMAADPTAALKILQQHAGLTSALRDAMNRANIHGLLYPTLKVVPDGLDNPTGGWAAELAARTGWPAISVPVIASLQARPVGIELLMPTGDETRLFALAEVFEKA
jgi:Asp-tRNA(Asn)/Glu-tRNA(Gln) amidotransferase A subunit family amidase